MSFLNNICKRRSLEGLNSEMRCTIDGIVIDCHANEMSNKHILGHGAFGTVFEMLHEPTKKVMAVKKLKFITSEPEKQKGLFRDLNISKEADSKYTVKFYGALLHEGDVWICMEKMDLSLDRFYLQVKKLDRRIPEIFIAKTALSVISGLKYLKDKLQIIHRDVKPSNILLNSDGIIRICDFGISGPLIDSVAITKDAGCKEYMAPERIDPKLSSKDYDTRSDVWSLGITLLDGQSDGVVIDCHANEIINKHILGHGAFGTVFEMLHKPTMKVMAVKVELAICDYPYKLSNNPFELIHQIVNEDPPRLPKGFSLNFENFINKCLEKKTHHRPKYKDLMEHQFLSRAHEPCFDIKKYATEIIDEYKKQPNEYETECM